MLSVSCLILKREKLEAFFGIRVNFVLFATFVQTLLRQGRLMTVKLRVKHKTLFPFRFKFSESTSQ